MVICLEQNYQTIHPDKFESFVVLNWSPLIQAQLYFSFLLNWLFQLLWLFCIHLFSSLGLSSRSWVLVCGRMGICGILVAGHHSGCWVGIQVGTDWPEIFLNWSCEISIIYFLTWCLAIARRKVSSSSLGSLMGYVWHGLSLLLLIDLLLLVSPEFLALQRELRWSTAATSWTDISLYGRIYLFFSS